MLNKQPMYIRTHTEVEKSDKIPPTLTILNLDNEEEVTYRSLYDKMNDAPVFIKTIDENYNYSLMSPVFSVWYNQMDEEYCFHAMYGTYNILSVALSENDPLGGVSEQGDFYWAIESEYKWEGVEHNE